MMHNVQSPLTSPESPLTARSARLNVPLPVLNVPAGNASTVAPLWLSVPRSAARHVCVPSTSSPVPAASPVAPVIVSVEHADPLSTSARFGSDLPFQSCGGEQSPTIVIDHDIKRPTSAPALSDTRSTQRPAADVPAKTGTGMSVIT